ncbi:MAG: hypothetical protein LBN34_08265 [Clostridiales Family XIII bacterium]|nr:hypothetical protein [Clostridiales Family XIII bacterium]
MRKWIAGRARNDRNGRTMDCGSEPAMTMWIAGRARNDRNDRNDRTRIKE